MHRIVSIGIAAVGVWLLSASLSLGVGSLTDPGPGLWPTAVATLLCVTAATLAVIESEPADYEAFTKRTGVVALAIATLAGYVVAFSWVGYIVPTFVVLLIWLRLISRETWLLTIVLSVGATLAMYLIFVVAFAVRFPDGLFNGTV